MAIWLARLAIDRWRLLRPTADDTTHPDTPSYRGGRLAEGEGEDAAPVALIRETAHGPRIDAVNRAATQAGVRTDMMLADARALCPQIATHPADAAGDLAFLEKMAVWAQRWGPWSAMDMPDGLLVDVTGAAHLFGGEQRLLVDAQAMLARRGLTARLAIAPTAGAAWALAHHGPSRAILDTAANDPQEEIAQRLSPLPMAALRLDDDVLLVMRRLGLKRLGDLSGIGRDALVRRFRNRRTPAANPLLRHDQLTGRVPEPLLPVTARPPAMVQHRLMEPIRHLTLLEVVLGDLAAALVRELEGRGEGARRIDFTCWRVDGEVVTRRLELAAASRDPAHICRLFTEKLQNLEAGFGFEMMRLTASWAEPLDLAQVRLGETEGEHGTSLAACIDRLATRLGPDAVRRAVPHASHLPERAQRWQAPLDPMPAAQEEMAFHHRPLKLLDRAETIEVLYATPDGLPRRFRWRGSLHQVLRAEGPERIAPEWWRERGSTRLRDYYRIEDGEGRRYWLYRAGLAGDGRGGLPQWFLHGLFA
ncbi:DNA polymerase Y family protein [Croceicoccus ponticola]|uniref:DNA polymerase Y family protein n=2 Tax=Croceicoccus ponticola TaxID=2217664 RepID=A0A437H2A8_9SPHN|nr:DNA polymerase Y family protein [Croceicoccus ponticola]